MIKDPDGFRTWVVNKLQEDDRIRGRGPSLCPLYRMSYEEAVNWFLKEKEKNNVVPIKSKT